MDYATAIPAAHNGGSPLPEHVTDTQNRMIADVTPPGNIEIRLVTSAAEREAVFRFRYDVYVTEMGRSQRYANHLARTVEEPFDKAGFILAAFSRDETVVGTVRCNFARSEVLGLYEELYGLARLDPETRRFTSVTTKLMVAEGFRKTPLALELAKAIYRFVLPREIHQDFIDCNDHLLRFFARLGYKTVQKVSHPEYGNVTVMCLQLLDIEHLRQVRSPFVPELTSCLETIYGLSTSD